MINDEVATINTVVMRFTMGRCVIEKFAWRIGHLRNDAQLATPVFDCGDDRVPGVRCIPVHDIT